ncbi:MAG: MFS transporter [Thermoanaerobaculum sp.]
MAETVPAAPAFWRAAFRALRHPYFRRYWVGWAISVLGSWMQTLAQGWLVFRLSHSPQALGFLTALRFGPSLVGLPFAGVLTDYFPRRRLLMVTQSASILQATVLAVLTLTGAVQIWHVFVLALVQGLIDAVDMPSRQSFQVELVPVADLQSAVSLNSTVFNAGRLVGPALAGLVVAEFGEGWCFALNAASFLPFLAAVVAVPEPERSSGGKLEFVPQLVEGVRFAWQHGKIRRLLVAVFVTAVFGLSYSTLLPAFASKILGADAKGYGLLLAASGLGAMVGSLSVAAFERRRGTVVRAQMLLAVALGVLAASKALALAAAALVVAGLAVAAQLATTNGYIQTSAPDHLRARLISLYIWLFSGGTPLGGLVAGFVAERWGIASALGLGALLSAGAALVPVLFRAVRVQRGR